MSFSQETQSQIQAENFQFNDSRSGGQGEVGPGRQRISEYRFRYPRHDMRADAPERVNGHHAGRSSSIMLNNSDEPFTGESMFKSSFKAPSLPSPRSTSVPLHSSSSSMARSSSPPSPSSSPPSASVYQSCYSWPSPSSPLTLARAPPSIFVSGGSFAMATSTARASYRPPPPPGIGIGMNEGQTGHTLTAADMQKKLRKTVVGVIGEKEDRTFHTEHGLHYNNKGYVARPHIIPFKTGNIGIFGSGEDTTLPQPTYKQDYVNHHEINHTASLNNTNYVTNNTNTTHSNKTNKSISSIHFDHGE